MARTKIGSGPSFLRDCLESSVLGHYHFNSNCCVIPSGAAFQAERGISLEIAFWEIPSRA
jgi:hypothetical protein